MKQLVGFPPALSEVFCTSIQTLSTSSFASLNVTFFEDVPSSGAPKENIVQNHLNIALLNAF